MKRSFGFTLIELMIVVAIIGILASIAVPKFSDLLRKSQEGQTKGNLGQMRSVINIYYADMEGRYPTAPWQQNSAVLASLVPKYVKAIPTLQLGRYHATTDDVFCHQPDDFAHDGTGWAFLGASNYPTDTNAGHFWIFCTHTDMKGTAWYAY